MMIRRQKCSAAAMRGAILAALCVATPCLASTIDALLGGHELQLKYADGAEVRVSFSENGTYRTSAGSSGTWTLDGEGLCTVRESDQLSSCGVLDSTKTVGEPWPSTDGDGIPVTATVMPVP